jgi:putative nucleotidyltransferase with HDIG domain
MNKLCIFSDGADKAETLRRQFGGIFELMFLDLDHVHAAEPQSCLLFDIDLRDSQRLPKLRESLSRRPKDSKVVFVTDKASHVQVIQARALGATGIVHRPYDAKVLVKKLLGEFETLSNVDPESPIKQAPGVGAALDALHEVFLSATCGARLDTVTLDTAGDAIVGQIEEQGLRSWVDTVRRHHSQTYQHCLLVTGVAAAFGQHLGFSRADRHRLSFAGLVHDIGKACVPIAILEKPMSLTAEEMALLRKHPEFGIEALKSTPELSRDMLDIVANHHEYLDGSGYPHGLSGNEISDFVRIATICDVFGALLERRTYKEAIRGDVAYQMLLDMGPKLDKALVREFRFASALALEAGA